MIKGIKVIVPGGLNTDIIGVGVDRIVEPGELSSGGELRIGPGGKSRNIAQMIAVLAGGGTVAMIGRTCKDPFQLWKPPVDALKEVGVNTDYIKILDFKGTYPGIALIPVDKDGRNQIYALPGVNNEFSEQDVDDAEELFETAQENKGILALSLELPLATALHSIRKARVYGLRVVLDPGGLMEGVNYDELLEQDLFLIKPNEYEAKILTGVTVSDFKSAKEATGKLLDRGIENVLITAGKDGAYFFNGDVGEHIPTVIIDEDAVKDETGCGDQTTATLCAALIDGEAVLDAAKTAVLSGCIQFTKVGIVPVTKEEIHR